MWGSPLAPMWVSVTAAERCSAQCVALPAAADMDTAMAFAAQARNGIRAIRKIKSQ